MELIPKKIYYVWFGRQPLPTRVQANLASWRRHNPDYEIIQINEDNFDFAQYRFARQAYDAEMWAFVADVVRLAVLHQFGGFYLDTDVRLIKPLDSLRECKSVWGLELAGQVNSGLIIGAHAGDDDLANLIERYQQIEFDPNRLQQVITTKIVSRYFFDQGLARKNRLQVLSNGTCIFPSKYFAPYHYWGGGHLSKETIAIHEYSDTWGINSKSPSKIPGFLPEARYLFHNLFEQVKSIFKG